MSALPLKSRAAVFHGSGSPLTVEEFPIPELKGTEVLARVRCATLCGSDLHTFFGRRSAPAPSILGHEMVAEIAAIGPEGAADHRGNPLGVGDRITWSMVWSCGECFYCQIGLSAKCEQVSKFGHEPIGPERALFGGLAEYCHLPEKTAIFRVPDDVSDRAASPANCATATVAAALRRAGNVAGQAMIIHGAGMLGISACAMASLAGAGPIIVLEPEAARREMARKFGATEAVDAAGSPEEIHELVLDRTEGRGADLALEFSGLPSAVELGLPLLRPGGRFLLVGAAYPSRAIQISGEEMVKRMLTLTGVYNYQPADLEFALNFLAHSHDKLPFDELVGRTFPLSEVNEAFVYAAQEKPPRVAVRP